MGKILVNENVVEFGSYPQSLVKDENIIKELNFLSGNLPVNGNNGKWTSYKYYINGTNDSDYMWFIDTEYKGNKYRGVYFTSFRPITALDGDHDPYEDSDEEDGAYGVIEKRPKLSTGTVYWYKYETLAWEVLDVSDGRALLLSDAIIDCQAFDNLIDYNKSGDWEESSIRAWLNETFYNTAFNETEKSIIVPQNLVTEIFWPHNREKHTTDTVYLLTCDDVSNSSYGFIGDRYDSDGRYKNVITDYAFCNSCDLVFSTWWLRDSGMDEPMTATSIDEIWIDESFADEVNGVVPAITINLEKLKTNTTIAEDSVAEDLDKLSETIDKIIKIGDAQIQYDLGLLHYNKAPDSDNFEALRWFIKAANQGHAEAQCYVGEIYYWGQGIKENKAEAYAWYIKSAENGNAEAQFVLGVMNGYGYGVKEDHGSALKWFKESAKQGYADAQCFLGSIYEYGKWVKRNYKTAIRWYKAAAQNGDETAMYDLGRMYDAGKGTDKDMEEAFKWYMMSAENGWVPAQFSVANMYQHGEGVNKDLKKALKWYRKAAKQGDYKSQCNLAHMYSVGEGTAQNHKEAAKWYRKAAKQGDEIAQCNLGWKYYKGEGVKQSLKTAVKWIKESAANGYKPAKKLLKEIIKESN